MRYIPALLVGKVTYWVTQLFHLGAGSTWPGEVALSISPQILPLFTSQLKRGIVIVAGTNGKTTTSLMIKQILEKKGETVVHNETGANLLNGVVSALIKKANWMGNIEADWGVFEVDENSLPLVVREVNRYSSSESQTSREVFKENIVRSRFRSNNKLVIVLLNLFRDQLDRYGEVDVIAEKWEKALTALNWNDKLTLVLNADDPLIAHLGIILDSRFRGNDKYVGPRLFLDNKIVYFGITDEKQFLKEKEHATDSTFCLNCGARFHYKGVYYSHIGIWKCEKCGEKRPDPDISKWVSPLPGVYNQYNTLAAVATAKSLDILPKNIEEGLKSFLPAFGRQEEFTVNGRVVKIFLSKNPTGFNQSLKTILELGATQKVLFVLNDRIPDGKDISWIWDVDFEMMPGYITPVVSGDRAHDLAVRLKYAKQTFKIPEGAMSAPQTPILVYEDLQTALTFCLDYGDKSQPLYILPTYSAMLEVRKILRGRKIL